MAWSRFGIQTHIFRLLDKGNRKAPNNFELELKKLDPEYSVRLEHTMDLHDDYMPVWLHEIRIRCKGKTATVKVHRESPEFDDIVEPYTRGRKVFSPITRVKEYSVPEGFHQREKVIEVLERFKKHMYW